MYDGAIVSRELTTEWLRGMVDRETRVFCVFAYLELLSLSKSAMLQFNKDR